MIFKSKTMLKSVTNLFYIIILIYLVMHHFNNHVTCQGYTVDSYNRKWKLAIIVNYHGVNVGNAKVRFVMEQLGRVYNVSSKELGGYELKAPVYGCECW